MKTKFPRNLAIEAASDVMSLLYPACDRIILAGSLRRGKPEVGDVEILYIPKLQVALADLFGKDVLESAAMAAIEKTLYDGILQKRQNALGHEMWGARNKFAVHVASGVPVDLFATTHESWFNYLVFRTGGAESNKRVAMAAAAKGWTWRPYKAGFSRGENELEQWHFVASEEDVFEFAGMPCLPPEKRP